MNIRTFFTGAVTAASLLASSSYAEELSVATFVPPQHATNTILFDWFGKELERAIGRLLNDEALSSRSTWRRTSATIQTRS